MKFWKGKQEKIGPKKSGGRSGADYSPHIEGEERGRRKFKGDPLT